MIEGPDSSYYAIQVEDVIEPKLKPFDEAEAEVKSNWELARNAGTSRISPPPS